MVTDTPGFLLGIFFFGAKSIVIQFSVVMLIFLLFSDQISERGKVSEAGKLLAPPLSPPVEESQTLIACSHRLILHQ